jgi:Mlc titration factor MtfA (ptsG expression regulator)
MLALVLLLLLAWWLWRAFEAFRLKRLEREIACTPTPEHYRKVLERLPHYRLLNDEEKTAVERSLRLFIRTKEFEGVRTDINDEMRVVVAFYACLLVLHAPIKRRCYPHLFTVLVYPTAVVYDEVREEGGIRTEEKVLLDGQASREVVVIVWHDAKKEAYRLTQNNVIVHEFAHELDALDGWFDGTPPLPVGAYESWREAFSHVYETLHREAQKGDVHGRYAILGAYAGMNEAEFFAVATERFFGVPRELKQAFEKLYDTLATFYGIDWAKRLDEAEFGK